MTIFLDFCKSIEIDRLVKSLEGNVTPAQAGDQNQLKTLDSRLRENDKKPPSVGFSGTVDIDIKHNFQRKGPLGAIRIKTDARQQQ